MNTQLKKIIVLLTPLLVTTISVANEPGEKIDFDKITTQQLTDITNYCLDNNYKSETCQQLKKWQIERKNRMEQAAKQFIKHM